MYVNIDVLYEEYSGKNTGPLPPKTVLRQYILFEVHQGKTGGRQKQIWPCHETSKMAWPHSLKREGD